jgi:hypothetical protein
MSITTYSELKTAIANWVKRTDLTDRLPEFIALAEDSFNSALRLSGMEEVTTYSTTGRRTALPADFLEMRSLEYSGSPLVLMPFGSPEYISAIVHEDTAGIPWAFSIRGTELEVFPAGSYDFTLHYWQKIPALSDSNTTNFLLSLHPLIYLYGSVLQAAIYTLDTELQAKVTPVLAEAIELAKQSDNRKRYPRSGLAIKVM